MTLRSLNAVELAAMTRFLRGYARSQLRSADQADDVVQEALAAALAARTPFDGRSTLRTWLVGILRNKICDHFRRTAKILHHMSPLSSLPDEDSGDESNLTYEPHEEIDHRTDPARIFAARQMLAAAGRALEQLPERSAAAYVLCELEGYETEEACDRLGVSPGNLWVIVHRARKAVRASLPS